MTTATLPMPNAPTLALPNVSYTPMFGFNPRIYAYQAVGTDNVASTIDAMATHFSTTGAIRDVALDIETKGVDTDTWWQITCITAAFRTNAGIAVVLLDPLRDIEHRKLLRRIVDLAERAVFHNAVFDIPPLIAHGLLTLDDVNKVWDTLVLARQAETGERTDRSLEGLSRNLGITPDDGIKIAEVFRAAGHRSAKEGFANSDINSPTYRDGAMSDTVVTLRLLPMLEAIVLRKHDASTGSPGANLTTVGARELIRKMQRNNQITLRRMARGFKTDPDYLDKFNDDHRAEEVAQEDVLKRAGLEPGRGDKLIEKLDADGDLPDDWPRTKGGRLSADKKALERLIYLNHPLASAHRAYANITKVRKYLEKVNDQVRATGRLHPMLGVLGAAATGRMSVTGIELQQFPDIARGIIVSDSDDGWTSVDWSAIEPVTMAVCAGDNEFLREFYAGGDLYIPVAVAATLIPPEISLEEALGHKGRKIAKIILLAAMYGQGAKSLASQMSGALHEEVTSERVMDLKEKMSSAMPVTFDFMQSIIAHSRIQGSVTTIGGRVLTQDADFAYRAVNHFCQGSAADVMYEATLRVDDMGLADHIHLWQHDELVVDSTVANQVNEAMQTPPECLLKWARTDQVILRTDMNEIGMAWKAV